MTGAYPPLSEIDPFVRIDGFLARVAIGIGPLYRECDFIAVSVKEDLVIWLLSDTVAEGVLDSIGGTRTAFLQRSLQRRYAGEMKQDPRWSKAVQDIVGWCSLAIVMVQ